jgi:hypothetical protein
MNPTSFHAAIRAVKGSGDNAPPPLRLRSLVWRSALLNLAIVLTAFPVLASAGGPGAVVPALVVMAAISALIWTATFTAFFFLTMVRAFWCLGLRGVQRRQGRPDARDGLADRWLDDPA